MLTRTIFIRPNCEFIRESVCTCAKSFVDEESTWHKSNHGIEQNIDGFYRKMTQKGGFSKLCVKINQRLPGACNRSPGSKLLSITMQLHCGGHLCGRVRLPDTILEEDHPMTIPSVWF